MDLIKPISIFTGFVILCLFPIIFAQTNNEFNLNILHLNDFHARFEQTNIYSGRCSERDASANKCYGGFARIHSKLKELRNARENVVFLAAGDYYQGTVWYTIHRWRAMAHFLNLIGQDVMSVGNHEFDDGIDGLVPFLDNVTFPVLGANIDDSLEPSVTGKILPSVVLERGGRKIGIVGYVTTETTIIANPRKLKILDEVESVRKESRRLRQNGVEIIIALGHAGFRRDNDIAREVEDVDIVVGGHTNTFLYTGSNPSTEPIMGEYPTVVKQKSGRVVLVVQAYAFGKYLGDLNVTFDQKGEVIRWGGNPILLDNTVPQDPEILKELIPWRQVVDEVISETIGRTFVFLDGNRMSCRMKECNLGNLETDAIVHQNAKYPDDMEWAKTALAVINGGGIRGSMDETASNGSISMEDILTVAPFQNTIDIVELKGRHVRQMFEHSVGNYDPVGLDPPGRFLQVSGFHVVYDITKPVGSRVVSLAARCSACRIPDFREVQDEVIYKVAMPSFLANGGDGYSVVRDNKVNHHLTGLLDTDIITTYIQLFSPIYQGIENRVLFIHPSQPCSALQDPPLTSNSSSSTTTTSPTSQSFTSNFTSSRISNPVSVNPEPNPLLSPVLSSSSPVKISHKGLNNNEGGSSVLPIQTLSKNSITVNEKDQNLDEGSKNNLPDLLVAKSIVSSHILMNLSGGENTSSLSLPVSQSSKSVLLSVQTSSKSSLRQNSLDEVRVKNPSPKFISTDGKVLSPSKEKDNESISSSRNKNSENDILLNHFNLTNKPKENKIRRDDLTHIERLSDNVFVLINDGKRLRIGDSVLSRRGSSSSLTNSVSSSQKNSSGSKESVETTRGNLSSGSSTLKETPHRVDSQNSSINPPEKRNNRRSRKTNSSFNVIRRKILDSSPSNFFKIKF